MTPARVFVAIAALVAASCVSVQDYGGEPEADGGEPAAPPEALGPDSEAPGSRKWQWTNPMPTGTALLAVSGRSDSDLWVAGEKGFIGHFDGTRWDVVHSAGESTRWFSIGVRDGSDVWIAGTSNGATRVVRYDGKEWIDSHPFAGSGFRGFSSGSPTRLFAVVDWAILELGDDGKWADTDTSANPVFGPPAGVWVSSSGEAWALTTGAKLLYLPAGSRTWQLLPPVSGVSPQAVGIAISGAGTRACAFVTGRSSGAGGGAGFLSFDGSSWTAGPTSTDLLTIDDEPHGSTSACLSDGTGILVEGDRLVEASPTSAPSGLPLTHFPNERLFAATSFDGSKAYAVGSFGALLERSSGSASFQEKGSNVRKDLLGVDVGDDGAVMLVDAHQPDRSFGGDVLFFENGALRTRKTAGLAAPSFPVAITVLAADDAWVAAVASASIGVAHFTGKWGVTRSLGSGLNTEPLAIWAPAKDDVWVTGATSCTTPLPGGGCGSPQTGFVWHLEGGTWKKLETTTVYRSIHGTGPTDVWFAGDGVGHWDGNALSAVPSLERRFDGVWSSAQGRVWLWGERALLFDGTSAKPIQDVLQASVEWDVRGIAESKDGDVFVLSKRAVGTSLLWFDPSRTRLVEQLASDLELTTIRGRGSELWAVGMGGASLRFAPPVVR